MAVWTVAAGGLTTVDRKSLKTLKKPVMVPPVPSTIEVSAENTPEVFTSTAGLLASWTVVTVLFVAVITGDTGAGVTTIGTVAAGGLTTVDIKSLKTLKKPVIEPPDPLTTAASSENMFAVFTSTAEILASCAVVTVLFVAVITGVTGAGATTLGAMTAGLVTISPRFTVPVAPAPATTGAGSGRTAPGVVPKSVTTIEPLPTIFVTGPARSNVKVDVPPFEVVAVSVSPFFG